ncbi:putative RNA-binding protein [Gorgonomyces haynaldii]|nr:putative RNA-binding protein [Gorgonomyces haynaldii]
MLGFRRLFSITPAAFNKIYVGNLAWGATEDSIRSSFAKFGAINDCFIVRDRLSGRSKGFGFVTFQEKDSADAAIKEMNEAVFEGRNLKVASAVEKQRTL